MVGRIFSSEISPNPSFSKTGIPPFSKEGRRDFVFGVYLIMD
jgi:hypothetical protein